MSRLPQLEAQLVAAAAVRPRPRGAPRRIAAVLVASAAAAAAVLALAPRGEQAVRVPAARPGVPESTIALSHALAAAPAPVREPVAHAALPAVAAAFEARTPYPPGARDDFDWEGTPADPRSMSSINYGDEVQRLVEYRAYCLWLRYWLTGDDRAGAATVIADIPSWPTQRGDAYQARIVADVQAGDGAPVQREVEINCSGV